MLHSLLRLQTDESGGPRLVSTGQRSWRSRIVVGRELCVFEAVSCRGVAWHEIGSFAALQAKRLAPYVRSGASAAVRNKTLMLWFWDEQEVESGLRLTGQDRSEAAMVAEPLMLALPMRDGELRLRCANGFDVMTLQGGAIIRSRWESQATGPSSGIKLLSRPWARDHLGGSVGGAGVSASNALQLNKALTAVSVSAAIGCGVYAAYWGGSLLGAQKRLAALEGDAQTNLDRMEKLASLRQREAQDRDWVASYRRLGGSFQLELFLKSLAPVLEAKSLVVKELEVRNDEARVSLASAGADIDLPGTLEVLAAIPGVDNVALRDNTDTKQATFTFNSARFRRISRPMSPRP